MVVLLVAEMVVGTVVGMVGRWVEKMAVWLAAKSGFGWVF